MPSKGNTAENEMNLGGKGEDAAGQLTDPWEVRVSLERKKSKNPPPRSLLWKNLDDTWWPRYQPPPHLLCMIMCTKRWSLMLYLTLTRSILSPASPTVYVYWSTTQKWLINILQSAQSKRVVLSCGGWLEISLSMWPHSAHTSIFGK